MCRMASFVVTKSKVYWSKISDSHEDIIKEFGLVDGLMNNIVRVEIAPAYYRYDTPIDTWEFKVDQNELPEWFDPEEAEKQCRLELPKWYESKIVIGDSTVPYTGKIYKIFLSGHHTIVNQEDGYCYFYGNSTGDVTGQEGGCCRFLDNSIGNITDQKGGDCWFCDNSTGDVKDQEGGCCRFFGKSSGNVTDQKGGYCWFDDNSSGKITGQKGGYCCFCGKSKRIN